MEDIPSWQTMTADWVADRIGAPRGLQLRQTPVGAGQVAECRRLELMDADTVVASVVAKAPSSDATSAATAAGQRLYLRETSFYKELAPLIGTPTPICYFVARDEHDNFLLLLDDLAPSESLDQFSGLSVQQVEYGLAALANLHVPTTDAPELYSRDWLGGTKEALAPLYQAIVPGLFTAFLDRYHEADAAILNLVREFADRLPTYSGQKSHFECVVHGDFRTDNLLFGGRSGEVPLAVVDWQTVSVSSPLLDVAYFLITSVQPELLLTRVEDFLSFYLDVRSELGGPIDRAIARQELSRYALQPVAMLVPAAVIVERTERGDRMFLEMLRRASTVCSAWNSLEELDRSASS